MVCPFLCHKPLNSCIMKKYVAFYYEGKREVCYTLKANSEDEARIDFEYLIATGEIYPFNWKKGYTISECY